ncbi:GNAT family N-acetyltransferase [Flaviflexus equikiangi]|uniref:GNAT family N-acetyltransferase n=1 Tax=Flaviflexus equikiangi TaxID=2758573 RepID=A0ABS2TE09_9ACTO|nr:GNAT family N-acetyltransferase [Flaviflexus equikiangi]MBM9432890.1 GNAT family N-acetyltransferase [Flaviflexus equikiangi]
MTSVRYADAADLAGAAQLLAVAFRDYPWTRYVVPEEDYDERLRGLYAHYLGHAHRHGFVAAADDGAVAVLAPRAPEPAAVDEIIALHGDRVDRLGGGMVCDDAWTIEAIGVHPSSRGHGRGSELLAFALDGMARRGAGKVVVDTSDPRNVRLYERHGFRIVAERTTPSGPPVWTMLSELVPAER